MEEEDIKVKTIEYDRKFIKEILGSFNSKKIILVFDVKKLKEDEKDLINCYYNLSNLNYTMFNNPIFEKTFFDIIKRNETRFMIDKNEAIKLINKIIDEFALYDFWVVSKKFIICFNHEHEICVIKRPNYFRSAKIMKNRDEPRRYLYKLEGKGIMNLTKEKKDGLNKYFWRLTKEGENLINSNKKFKGLLKKEEFKELYKSLKL